MRKIREILRLKHTAGLSIRVRRQIHVSTKVSVGAIQKLLSKAEEQQLTWPLPEALDDRQLARLFYCNGQQKRDTYLGSFPIKFSLKL